MSEGTRDGDTPLVDAVRHGRTDAIAKLLASGVDVNQPTTDGLTPLFIAWREGHAQTASILLGPISRWCR